MPETGTEVSTPDGKSHDLGLIMLKPDGVAAGSQARARSIAAAAGIELVDTWRVRLGVGHIVGLWPMVDPAARPITHLLLRRYLDDRHVAVDVYRGPDALGVCDRMKDELRRQLNDLIYANTVHSADRPDEVAAQYELLRRPEVPVRQDGLLPPTWSRWRREEIEETVTQLWNRLGDGRPARDHWALRLRSAEPAEDGPGTVSYVGATWNFGFDTLVDGFATALRTDDLDTAICAALAALYDDGGFFLAGGKEIERLEAGLAPLGVTVLPAADRAAGVELIAGRPRWCTRLTQGGCLR